MEAREFNGDSPLLVPQRQKAMADGCSWGGDCPHAASQCEGLEHAGSQPPSWAPPSVFLPIPCREGKASEKHEKEQGRAGWRGQDWMG